MVKKKKIPNLDKDEIYCEKCKEVVHKTEFNVYYEICHDCVNGRKK